MGVRGWLLGAVGLIWLGVPAPAEQKEGSLFPAGAGSRWSYKGTAAGQPLNMEASISSSKTAQGKKTVLMHWTMNGSPVQDETYIVTALSVSRAKSGPYGNTAVSPPMPILMYPVAVGKSWKWKGHMQPPSGARVAASATLKVGAREKVKSGAGTFDTYRIDMVLTVNVQGRELRIPNNYWFAPGAGLVRQRATIGEAVIDATVTKVQVK